MLAIAHRLRAVTSYDPATGLFRWRGLRQRPDLNGRIAGNHNQSGYWNICFEGKLYKAHRLAWLYVHGEWPKRRLDHENGNTIDNRIENLRLATHSQNIANSRLRRDSTSGFKGVSFYKAEQKWGAYINKNKKRYFLGLFLSPQAAGRTPCICGCGSTAPQILCEGIVKIIKLHCENIKKIKVVSITPDGSIIQITGPNGSGKTSVLDAIYWALAGGNAIDSKPVRDGTESATITLDLGEFTVIRTFKADGATTKLEVITAAGAKYPSPQKRLDALLGSLTFDPLAFARAEAKEQLNGLRRLVPLDIDIDELDLENRRDFDARTNINRDVKALEAQVNAAGEIGLIDAPADSPSALLAQMEQASDHNRAVDTEARRRADFSREITYKDERLRKLEGEIADLRVEISALEAGREAWEPEIAKIDVADLRARVEAASERQREHEESKRALAAHEQLVMKLEHARMTSEEFTAAMASRHSRRMNAIAAAKMPVDGLGFGEGEVTYNGLPFAQASGAEQLRVSVAIAMAGNPKLRVLRIKDGSLLDSKSLALLEEMADLNDFQVWIESVDESGTVGIVMEDGAVALVHA